MKQIIFTALLSMTAYSSQPHLKVLKIYEGGCQVKSNQLYTELVCLDPTCENMSFRSLPSLKEINHGGSESIEELVSRWLTTTLTRNDIIDALDSEISNLKDDLIKREAAYARDKAMVRNKEEFIDKKLEGLDQTSEKYQESHSLLSTYVGIISSNYKKNHRTSVKYNERKVDNIQQFLSEFENFLNSDKLDNEYVPSGGFFSNCSNDSSYEVVDVLRQL